VCLGLACDARLKFDASDETASGSEEAREVLRSIFQALAGQRAGRLRSRAKAKLDYERKLGSPPPGWRSPRVGRQRTEFFSAVFDLLNGDDRPSKARRSNARHVLKMYGMDVVVGRLRREKPLPWSELEARREAIALTAKVFRVSPETLRKSRGRDRLRS
jgi:hypothetical protein